MENTFSETSGTFLRLKAFSDFRRSGKGRPLASLIPDSSLAREALLFPTASRASRHRLHNAGSWPAFPGKSPLPRAHRGSCGPSFLCVFPEIKRRQRERRHVPGTLGPVTRRARPGRVGRRAATRKRIHIETLPHVLDEVGRLLAMRQLFIRFHSAAAARRVLQLFSSKEPARRSSTARRHDTSSSARTLSPPPPRLLRGLRANASRPRPNALSVGEPRPFRACCYPCARAGARPAGSHWSSGRRDHNAPRLLSLGGAVK